MAIIHIPDLFKSDKYINEVYLAENIEINYKCQKFVPVSEL